MTYYVNLGGLIIYGIKSVSDDSARDLTTYDGLGQGAFAIPESAKPREWSIECEFTEKDSKIPNWSAASRMFDGFEVLLNTKDPSRFIFVSENRNMSISGYLSGYSKKEESPGVYQVTVKVVEYKAVGIKTTEVPYISRPGKAPTLPDVVVFDSHNTPYRAGKGSEDDDKPDEKPATPAYQGPSAQVSKNGTFKVLDTATGKYITNPALVVDGKPYKPAPKKTLAERDQEYVNSFFSKQAPKEQGAVNIQKAFDAIKNAFTKARAAEIERRKKHDESFKK